MELTPKRKPKPTRPPQQPPQWRLRAPVSKADKDAIKAFQRSLKLREWLEKQLEAATLKVKSNFEALHRRGQLEAVVPLTDTTAPDGNIPEPTIEIGAEAT